MTKLRVVTWNILDGGVDNSNHDRLLNQLALLRGLDVDIAGIQEAKYWDWDGHRLLHLAERELGLRGFLARSNSDGCHLVIFVREPKIQIIQQRHRTGPPYWHGLACLKVRVDGFPYGMDVVNAHLAPSAPGIRLQEAETFQLLNKHACVVVGDWNAAPADGVEVPVPDGGDPEHVRRKLDRRAAQAIESAGFVDVGAHCADDTPTVGFARDDTLAYRCDRVYVNQLASAVASYRVIKTANELSDHRPVLVELDLRMK